MLTAISGNISNCKEGLISIEYQREFLIKEKINLTVSKAGNISVKIDVLYPVLLQFSNSQIRFEAYIYPGSGISFSANGMSQIALENSLKFTGSLGSINNAFFNLYHHSMLKSKQWSTGDKAGLSEIIDKIKEYYKYKDFYLHEAVLGIKADAPLKAILLVDSINDAFTKASALLTLSKKNGLMKEERQKFLIANIPSSIFNFPSQKELQIPAVTNFWNYTYLSFLISIDAEKEEGLYKNRGYYLSALNKVDTSFKQPLKDYSKASLLSDLIESPKDFRPGTDSLLRVIRLFIQKASLSNEIKSLLEERSNALVNISVVNLEGKSAPSVDLRNLRGEKIVWSQFQDSIVVVDCWASWCAPCIAQFPYLEGLKQQFKNKKVAFIAISFDGTKTNWEKSLKNLSLSGTQLYTSGGFKGDFAKKFAVNALPRYILIKNSSVINNDAPLPNDPSLIEELNKHLLK